MLKPWSSNVNQPKLYPWCRRWRWKSADKLETNSMSFKPCSYNRSHQKRRSIRRAIKILSRTMNHIPSKDKELKTKVVYGETEHPYDYIRWGRLALRGLYIWKERLEWEERRVWIYGRTAFLFWDSRWWPHWTRILSSKDAGWCY